MKKQRTGQLSIWRIILSAAVFAILAGTIFSASGFHARAATGINSQLNFQGRLADNTGAIVADGTYNMRFKIYQDGDGVLGGGDETIKWTESWIQSNRVTVRNGYFSVNLNAICASWTGGCASNGGVDWNQDTIWLSIDIGGTTNTPTPTYDGEMSPFKRMSATPYALNANNLQGLAASAFGQLSSGNTWTNTNTFQNTVAVNTSNGITSNQATLTINAAGAVDIQDAVTADSLTLDTGALAVNNSGGITSNQATFIINAGGTTEIQDSLNITGTSVTATAATTVTLGSSGTDTITIGNGGADNVTIAGGSAASTVTIGNASSSAIKLGKFTTANGLLYVSATDGTVSETAASTGTQCLQTASSGSAPIWGACGGSSGVSLAPASADNPNSANTAIFVNQSGTGSLIRLQSGGTDKFLIDNAGSTVIYGNGVGDDILKDTTSDYTQGTKCATGAYCLTTSTGTNTVDNLSTSGNQVSLITDLYSNGYTAAANSSGPAMAGALVPSAGSFTVQIPDKRFVTFLNNGTTLSTEIYDPSGNSYSLGPTLVTSSVNAGALAFQRADGNFIIVRSNNTTGTILYSPGANATGGTLVAGPVTSAVVGAGALMIPRTDGKKLLLHGGTAATTSIYDPVANTFNTVGPAVGGGVTNGSFAFQVPNGKWIVGIGGSTTTRTYDPATTGTGGGGTFTTGPTLPASPATGTGVIQLPNGNFMVMLGSSTATAIYDVSAGTFSSGQSASCPGGFSLGGNVSMQRSDGKWLIECSSGNQTLYDPSANSFSNPGNLGVTLGFGSHAFQRPDGKYIVVSGNGFTSTTIVDVGWNTAGTWTSEGISSTKLSSASKIFYSVNMQSANNNSRLDQTPLLFSVRTWNGSCSTPSGTFYTQLDSGQLINTVAGATCAQVKVDFNIPLRSIPSSATDYISQSNVWSDESATYYRRSFIQPTVFNMRIENPLISYGNMDGTNGDGSLGLRWGQDGATFEGVIIDPTTRLTLATNRNLPTSAAAGGFQIQSIAANLGANSGAGAHVLDLNNGKFLVILGGATTTTKLYDEATNAFSTGPTACTVGAGAHSFLMGDGRFFTVCGNASTTTNIYDPVANTFSAGPSLFTAAGAGANSFARPDGLYAIVSGGASTATQILDPRSLSLTQGPTTSIAVNSGGMNLRRPDGRILVIHGGATSVLTTSLYDPVNNSFVAGPAMTTSGATIGSSAVQLSNGKFWIKTTGTTTQIYDPTSNTATAPTPFTLGPATVGSAAAGDAVIPRSDGKILFMTGATSNIIDPANNVTAIAGQTLPCTLAAGSVVFQRSTGEYVVLCGGSTSTFIIDAGWNLGGTYTTQQMNLTNLSSNTSIFWKNVGSGVTTVKYRTSNTLTGLGLAAWQQMEQPGSKIIFNNGDVYFQARIDMQGSLTDMPGAKSRVWLSESNGGQVSYYRTVSTPILASFDLRNDTTPNALTIEGRGGADIFRFASDGQAYTSDSGAWNSGGADLAERYGSFQNLENGEVVVNDPDNPQKIKRSTGPYETNIMGVVSTQPGFVAGAYTEDSYPVALVGRVPVKVSTENGPIRSGDALTSGSIPGYAMKATYGGRILGYALEDFDPLSSGFQCPPEANGALPATQCGTVNVFVNLTNYPGVTVDSAMQQEMITAPDTDAIARSNIDTRPMVLDTIGITADGTSVTPTSNNSIDEAEKTLAFLKRLNAKDNAIDPSILTGELDASKRIITPQVITDTLIAKNIKADKIEGLDILVQRLTTFNQLAANQSTTQSSGGTPANDSAPGTSQPSDITAFNLKAVSELVAQGSLRVEGDSTFNGRVTFNKDVNFAALTTFARPVSFNDVASFGVHVIFGSDAGGYALIKKDSVKVEIKFVLPYDQPPIVVANYRFDDTPLGDSKVDRAEDKQLRILQSGLNYGVGNVNKTGFTLFLNQPAPEDINLQWLATQVKNAPTSIGIAPLAN
jgi:hypothetical protein